MQSASTIDSLPSANLERYETIVIGGGQAGLAVGYYLAEGDFDFVILDGEERVGNSWRRRWDSLRLFTPAAYNGLPGLPFPAPSWHLPDKDEVADYLERYAERFALPVRLDTRVDALAWDGERYVLRAGHTCFEANNVVVATGPFQRPWVPGVADRLTPEIHQFHSSEYRNPFDLPPGPVLVVGAGNSGAQIAMELAKHRKVWLAGKEAGHLPQQLLGRNVFAWLWPIFSHLTLDTRLGRRLRERARQGDPLIGILPSGLTEAGIERVGRLTDERGGLPVCEGEVIESSVIVWCTGFRHDYSWIEAPVLDAEGQPRHRRGVAVDMPGLYFVGLPFLYRRTSSLLGGVREDAAIVAREVARRCESFAFA